MRRAQRTLFWLAAGTFFVWQNAAMILWLREHGGAGAGVSHMWSAMTSDWMLLLILSDACIFSALALAWFYGDMRKRGFSTGRSSVFLFATIALGSPVLLIYLATRDS